MRTPDLHARRVALVAERQVRTSAERGAWPIQAAAGAGSVLLALEGYLIVKWVAGPNFRTVPAGPSIPPTWMKVGVVAGESAFSALLLFMVYWLIVRPWRHARTVTLHGLLIPALVLTSMYDPLSGYYHAWLRYNAYFVNFGNPLAGGIPGWHSFARPGATIAFPILLLPAVYAVVFIPIAVLGSKFLSALSRRWPRLPAPLALIVTFALIVGLDIILEGVAMMRLGWWAETGRSLLNAGHSYQLPWRNTFAAAAMWLALTALCHYRNDRGQTIVERGVDRYAGAPAKAVCLRFLAIFTAVQMILVTCYHLPVGLDVARDGAVHWPSASQSKSYLNDHICGYGTPRRCP
jgi:Spirocyclase AveC-like